MLFFEANTIIRMSGHLSGLHPLHLQCPEGMTNAPFAAGHKVQRAGKLGGLALLPVFIFKNIEERLNDLHDENAFGADRGCAGNTSGSCTHNCPERSSVRGVRITTRGLGL
jgi:hypothetical protein